MRAEEYRRAGDLILANLVRLEKGVSRADLTGHDGSITSVTLDPQRSPARNAEGYFKKYKKAKAGRDIIAERLHKARQEQAFLKSLSLHSDLAAGREDLDHLRFQLAERGYLKEDKGGGKKEKAKSALLPYKKLQYHGWEMLVGKNAQGNDYITMKLARPDDIWLHAEGLPGSHVLIRNAREGDIPQDVLMKAASLAAYHSKGRGAGKVPVTYARAKFVKKPKGAQPGTVTLAERKTIMAVPEVKDLTKPIAS